jgi:hypothetical protein
MLKNWMVSSILALALALPVVAYAHEGHVHNALGTITSVQGGQVVLTTRDGKALTVLLNRKTTVTRGKDKLDASALKVGERVSVDYLEENKVMMAQTIKLGAAPATRK